MVAIPSDIMAPTIAAIDLAKEDAHVERQQRRLSGGLIGKPCERAIWYRFHWSHASERFSGRMLRLFETGHREEDRMVSDLRSAGVTVFDRDDATGEQWEVTALDGHFVGKLDGIAVGFLEAPKADHVLEIKTHNDKSFAQLKKHKVAVAKPEHMAQMQVYMHLMGVDRAFYLAKNKNDDELYSERVHYDAAMAAALLAKAERILAASRPLPKISEDPDSFACRFCPSKDICHQGEFALRNCRTCLHSTPTMGGGARWHCGLFDRELSIEDQEAGCGQHLYVPDLVPGEQIDVSDDVSSVLYRLADGSDWWDGRNADAAASGGAA